MLYSLMCGDDVLGVDHSYRWHPRHFRGNTPAWVAGQIPAVPKTKKDLRSSQVPVASSLFNRAATEPRSTRWRIVTGKWGEVQRRASRIARGALRGYC